MPTKKSTKARKATTPRKRGPRPNNPYGIDNEEWSRLSLESSRKYPGKWIAWTPGHDKIVAVGDTFGAVDDETARLGFDVHTLIYQSPPRCIYTEIETGSEVE
ncbi:MAG TPA: hypothetical protein VGH33_13510 [Isosphaeraceae bacterium]